MHSAGRGDHFAIQNNCKFDGVIAREENHIIDIDPRERGAAHGDYHILADAVVINHEHGVNIAKLPGVARTWKRTGQVQQDEHPIRG